MFGIDIPNFWTEDFKRLNYGYQIFSAKVKLHAYMNLRPFLDIAEVKDIYVDHSQMRTGKLFVHIQGS